MENEEAQMWLPEACGECGDRPAEWHEWGDPDFLEIDVLCDACYAKALAAVGQPAGGCG